MTTVQGATAEVRLPGPLDIPGSLEPFRRWGDDLIDRWDGHTLLRTVRTGDEVVAWAAVPAGDVADPRLRVGVDDAAHLVAAVEAAGRVFVHGDPSALADLRRRDPVVAALEARHRGIRSICQPDLLTALVRSVSAQQVNLRWAATTRARLARATGVVRSVGGREVWALDAARLAATPVAALRALQLTTRKAEYLVGIAAEMVAGRLDADELRTLPDGEVIARLTRLRGVGHWTAEWLLSRTLCRPRVVAGDLGVRRAVGLAYRHGGMPTEAEVRRLTTHWGAAASVAQALLLHSLVTPEAGAAPFSAASRRPAAGGVATSTTPLTPAPPDGLTPSPP